MAVTGVIQRSMRLQWTLLRRDRRAILLGVLLLLVIVAALVGGVARDGRRRTEQARASAAEQSVWESQHAVNPHNAAHFGRYVFKPANALTAFEIGLTEHLGGAVHLEAHRQGTAIQRPAEQGTIFSRFGGFSFALALQVLAPLVVILIGFTSFAGGPARALLIQELAGGADPRRLMAGRLLGLGGVFGVLIVLLLVLAGVGMLLATEAGADGYLRLGWMVLSYTLYLLCFLALTLGVSASCREARHALVILLGIWLTAVVLVPRIAPAVADRAHPAPSMLVISQAVREQTRSTGPGGSAIKAEVARRTDELVRSHGVTNPDELPYSLGGLSLTVEEEFSTRLYREKFDELNRIYTDQAGLERWFTLLSPTVALRSFSAAVADADLGAHQHFLQQAETYRFQVVQALNHEQFLHAGKLKSGYTPDIRSIDVGTFQFSPRTGGAALASTWPDLLILFGWATAALLLAFSTAGRLARNP